MTTCIWFLSENGLGTILRSSARATSGFNHWDTSPFSLSSFSHLIKLLTMMGIVMNAYNPRTWGLRQKDLQYEAEWHLCWHNLAAYIKVKPRTLRQTSVVFISIGWVSGGKLYFAEIDTYIFSMFGTEKEVWGITCFLFTSCFTIWTHHRPGPCAEKGFAWLCLGYD